MYKSKRGVVAALTGVIVTIIIGMLFTKKNTMKKLVRMGKSSLEKGKEKITKVKDESSAYTDQLKEKARESKRHFKTANG